MTKCTKPSVTDLMNQIEDWRQKTLREIELYERFQNAKLIASKLL